MHDNSLVCMCLLVSWSVCDGHSVIFYQPFHLINVLRAVIPAIALVQFWDNVPVFVAIVQLP